jgi:hypothetical protein
VLFDGGRRGLPLQGLDIGRDRDGLNVFEVLIPGALSPGQELLDCPVVGVPLSSEPKRTLSSFLHGMGQDSPSVRDTSRKFPNLRVANQTW